MLVPTYDRIYALIQMGNISGCNNANQVDNGLSTAIDVFETDMFNVLKK